MRRLLNLRPLWDKVMPRILVPRKNLYQRYIKPINGNAINDWKNDAALCWLDIVWWPIGNNAVTNCTTIMKRLQASPIQEPIAPIGDWYGRVCRGLLWILRARRNLCPNTLDQYCSDAVRFAVETVWVVTSKTELRRKFACTYNRKQFSREVSLTWGV